MTGPSEDAFNTHNLELLRRAGGLAYGSTWFEDNWASWSAVAADNTQGGRDREIARLVLSLPGLVLSDSMTIDPDAPWAATTRVIPREGASREIERLKQAQDLDLVMFGSATTWNPLMDLGLVDELVVLVGPALLGVGSPLYEGSRVALHLLDAEVLHGSDLVRLRYTPARNA